MNKLKELRLEKNLNQEVMAKFLNIKQNSYSQYETEKRDMPTKVLKKLSDFYQVSIDYLLNLTLQFTAKKVNNAK